MLVQVITKVKMLLLYVFIPSDVNCLTWYLHKSDRIESNDNIEFTCTSNPAGITLSMIIKLLVDFATQVDFIVN